MKFIFFHLETTGFEPGDEIIQLAYLRMILNEDGTMTPHGSCHELFHTDRPVSADAMARHHITPPMLIGRGRFEEQRASIADAFDGWIPVAFHAPSALAFLARQGIALTNGLCAHKIAKKACPQEKAFSLPYLRYAFGFYPGGCDITALGPWAASLKDLRARDAWSDPLALALVFRHCVGALYGFSLTAKDLQDMEAITARPALVTHFTFGKYRGAALPDVAAADPAYLHWLLFQSGRCDMDPDLKFSVEHFLRPGGEGEALPRREAA